MVIRSGWMVVLSVSFTLILCSYNALKFSVSIFATVRDDRTSQVSIEINFGVFLAEETLFQVSHIDRVYLLRAETKNER